MKSEDNLNNILKPGSRLKEKKKKFQEIIAAYSEDQTKYRIRER
jgi:hypothetical protein